MSGWRAAAAILLAAGALTGCTSAPPPDPADPARLPDCSQVACTGRIGGAAYEIVLPERWNGTLLLYSHGYRSPRPAPPDFAPPSRAPEPAPGWSDGQRAVGQRLLAQGYALAGSAYAVNGWAVAEGVAAGAALVEHFAAEVAPPQRVYAWGDSLGGLVTQLLAEEPADRFDAAAPLCAPLAGPVANFDLALDVAYVLRETVLPDLRLTGFASWEQATTQWQRAAARLLQAGRAEDPEAVAAVVLAAAVADAPAQTGFSDGSTPRSRVTAYGEAVLTALGFGTFGRFDVERRVGGNPSTNVGVDYAARLSERERAVLDRVAPGAADRLLRRLAAGQRVAADPAARARFAATGTPRGQVSVPTLTLHTAADPLVLVQNQSAFAALVPDGAPLRGLVTVPPRRYPPGPPPSGAGHCGFTEDERVGVVELLDAWARSRAAPSDASVRAALGAGSRVDPSYVVGPWPAVARTE